MSAGLDREITERVLRILERRDIRASEFSRGVGWSENRLSHLKNRQGSRWLVEELVEAAAFLRVPVMDLLRGPDQRR